jgi:hypothetical protein
VVVRPGVIKHVEGKRFSLGGPDRSGESDWCRLIAFALLAAGLEATRELTILVMQETRWLERSAS